MFWCEINVKFNYICLDLRGLVSCYWMSDRFITRRWLPITHERFRFSEVSGSLKYYERAYSSLIYLYIYLNITFILLSTIFILLGNNGFKEEMRHNVLLLWKETISLAPLLWNLWNKWRKVRKDITKKGAKTPDNVTYWTFMSTFKWWFLQLQKTFKQTEAYFWKPHEQVVANFHSRHSVYIF